MTSISMNNLIPSTRDILSVLQRHAVKTEWNDSRCYCCYISTNRIVKNSGWSASTAKAAINVLCAMEIVQKNSCLAVDCPRYQSKCRENHYKLLVDWFIPT